MTAEPEDKERWAYAFRLKEEARAEADRTLLAAIDIAAPVLRPHVERPMKERDEAIGWVNHWLGEATDQMARGDAAERERGELRAAAAQLRAVFVKRGTLAEMVDAITTLVNL